jgi:type II secretion system protein J
MSALTFVPAFPYASRSARQDCRSNGFTLIEVLMAAIASALIFAAIYGIFSNAMHLRDKATVRTHIAQMRARAVTVMQNDLKDALISGGSLAAVLTTVQTGHQSQFPGYLQFTTTNAEIADGQVGGDVQAIEYYIAEDTTSSARHSGTLVRTVNRNLLAETQVSAPQQPLISGVTSLEFDFFDGNTWQTSWTVANPTTDPLPQAVRVHIQLMGEGNGPIPAPIDLAVPWTTKIYIGTSAASSATSGTGTTTGGSTSTGSATGS